MKVFSLVLMALTRAEEFATLLQVKHEDSHQKPADKFEIELFDVDMVSDKKFKVVVCGGAGAIGQSLSLLMAMHPSVGKLNVMDFELVSYFKNIFNKTMIPPAGVAADLGQLEKPAEVQGFAIDPAKPAVDQLEECFSGADLLLMPVGMPKKPGMTEDNVFAVNVGIARALVESSAKYCPDAVVGLMMAPLNSILPAMAEIYLKKGLDPHKIVGVTTLDIVRANKFVSQTTAKAVSDIQIPVVGGYEGKTILPLFSQDQVGATLTADQIQTLEDRTQNAGTEVVEAKGGKGSATLSTSYAGARFAYAVLNGLSGTRTKEFAYVKSEVTELPYFTSQVTFGVDGVEEVHKLGPLSDHEKTRLVEVSEQLKTEIDKGMAWTEMHGPW